MTDTDASEASGVSSRPHTPSPSPSSATSTSFARQAIGRPKQSPVWNYFVYVEDSDKSVCQVPVGLSDGSGVCGHAVSGKYPTNMKQHLKRSHKAEYDEVLRQESMVSAKSTSIIRVRARNKEWVVVPIKAI